MNIRELQNIEPYNEIYYKECFYNSFFPIVNRYKKNIHEILANDIILYSLSRNKNEIGFNAHCHECKVVLDVIKNIGINTEAKTHSENVISDTREAILRDRPVIIWVDCYYLSIRKDTYQKKHAPHTLLIYGYDDDRRMFQVIEHDRSENLTYKKTELPYEDVVNANKGYLNNNFDVSFATFAEFFCGDEMKNGSLHEAIEIFSNNLKDKKQMILDSIELIKDCQDHFIEVVSSEQKIKESANVILNNLNNIINLKQIERYRLERFFGKDNPAYSSMEGIIKGWSHVRIVIAKYIFTSNYKLDAFLNAVKILSNIYDLEHKYNKALEDMIVV